MRCRAVAAAASVAVVSLVVAPSLASPSQAGVRPCSPGYSYAGYAGRLGADGVAATISASALPAVWSGHAAAWVGVGGIHQGPNGASEWLQAGIAAFPRVGLHLYVEEVTRGHARRFADLGPALVRRHYRVRVVETGRDIWTAFIEGRRVGRSAYLPTAGGSWRPVATAESWAAGRSSCNRYAYRFEGVSALQARGWAVLGDAERIGGEVRRERSGFSALG
ncbi:MAG: hypothetical protein E6G19_03465 [Actinobacteria bacterium]|nr:MAG: hypothetical protein E6G19_03465 [Actinomycetota bacterium]